MNSTSFDTLLSFAHGLADQARPEILRHFRTPVTVSNKAKGREFDPVTIADRDAETTISRAIRARFPEHGMVGEEHGDHNAEARFKWVVDPIDGTRAFIMGTPLWGTLIGLMDGEEPVLGLMDQPFTGERFWSTKSGAVMRSPGTGDSPLRTRRCPHLKDAVLTTTHPDLLTPGQEAEGFARLKARARMTRYGGDCYAYAMLAAGFIDLVVESGLKPFDVIALIPIVERAGGRISTWDGKPATSGGRIIAAGDAALHDAAMQLLAK